MTQQSKIDELQASLARFRGYLAQDPKNLNLCYEIIDVQTRLGEYQPARAEISTALKIFPNDAGLRFRLATLDIASGQSADAAHTLRAMQSEGIDNSVIRYNLGYALMLQGDYESAKAVFETIPLDDPQAPRVRVMLARCLHHLDEMEKGIELIRDFVASHTQDADALGVLALMEWDEGHNAEAVAAAKRALESDPNNIEAGIVMGTHALDEQNIEEAKADFNRVIQRHKNNGRAWSGLGLAHMADIDLANAMPALQNATEYMPDHIGTWHALAWCQIVQGDLAGARKNLEAGLALNRNFSESHGGLAVIAAMEQRYDDAEPLIRRALRLDPNSFSGRFAQSLVMNRTDPENAAKMIRDILDSKASAMSSQTLNQSLQKSMVRLKKHRH
jgi:tetratricopeptide (TPR) repeat protein